MLVAIFRARVRLRLTWNLPSLFLSCTIEHVLPMTCKGFKRVLGGVVCGSFMKVELGLVLKEVHKHRAGR